MDPKKTCTLVSIIMPTYNRAGLIIETIESIQRQTFTNWELIIVDDGSDDNTEKIIEQIKDERIQFYNAGRIGVGGKIKNIGLSMTKGDLVAFSDSDDPWADTKLEKQVEALQNYPGAGFCLTGGYIFRTPGEPIEYFYKIKTGTRYDNLFTSCFRSEVAMFAQTLLFRRECIETTGMFREVKSFSDIDFIASLAYYFNGLIIYDALVFRRLHDANYINANWEKSYFEGIGFIEANKEKLPLKVVREAFFKLYINFGEAYLKRKSSRKAITKFIKAWLNKPVSLIPLKKLLKALLSSLEK